MHLSFELVTRNSCFKRPKFKHYEAFKHSLLPKYKAVYFYLYINRLYILFSQVIYKLAYLYIKT